MKSVSRMVSQLTPRTRVVALGSSPLTLHISLNGSELEAHFPMGRLIFRMSAVSW